MGDFDTASSHSTLVPCLNQRLLWECRDDAASKHLGPCAVSATDAVRALITWAHVPQLLILLVSDPASDPAVAALTISSIHALVDVPTDLPLF
jgi:hypothetical protein